MPNGSYLGPSECGGCQPISNQMKRGFQRGATHPDAGSGPRPRPTFHRWKKRRQEVHRNLQDQKLNFRNRAPNPVKTTILEMKGSCPRGQETNDPTPPRVVDPIKGDKPILDLRDTSALDDPSPKQDKPPVGEVPKGVPQTGWMAGSTEKGCSINFRS